MPFRIWKHETTYDHLASLAATLAFGDHEPLLFSCNYVRVQKCACGGTRVGLGFLRHRVPLASGGEGMAVHELFIDVATYTLFWIGLETYDFDGRQFIDALPRVFVARGHADAEKFLPRHPLWCSLERLRSTTTT